MKKTMGRRRFLGGAAAVTAAPWVLPKSVFGRPGRTSPNDKVQIGIIGVGGMGRSNGRGLRRYDDCRVVAVCDVDERHRNEAADELNKHYADDGCAKYKDFRELIGREDIDAVVIATPDHWHAICCLEAAKAKKHIYCQKPMTHTFAEGQAVYKAVEKAGVTFQVGSQQRSQWNFRHAVNLVLNGHVGEVKRVEVGLPTGSKSANGDTKVQDPPPHADYDFWCGPSRKLPFTPARFHWNWRWHLSYGGGQLMDWIGHHNDIAHWGLGRDGSGPIEVRAAGFQYPEDRSVWNAAWEYEVLCKFDDGVESSISNKNPQGCKWIGDDGWVFVKRGKLEASNPAWVQRDYDPGPKKAYDSPEHHRNFLDGIRTGDACICPAETGHRSITPGHLGLVSQALGARTLQWDPEKEVIVGDKEADDFLKRVYYRDPWKLEA